MARRPTRKGTGRGSLPRRSIENHCLEHFEWFAGTCKLPDGLGPFILEPYERVALADYFSGIPETLLLFPTGQRKSMLLGLLGLHCATYVRASARVFILGGLGGHGRNALDAAAGFVERDPKRLGRWWVLQEYGMGRLKSTFDRGVIVVVSAGRRVGGRGGSSVEGENPDLILVEELHRHEDNGAALATIQSKAGKKSNAGWIVQTLIVTTAGDNLESSLGRKIAKATDEAVGAVVTTDEAFGPYYRRGIDEDGDLVMHEFAVPDDIQPPSKADGSDADRKRYSRELKVYLGEVKKANPASFVTIEKLRRSFKALSGEPWTFARQHCNQWVVQDYPAIDRARWAQGLPRDSAGAPLGVVIPEGAEGVVIGLDASDTFDKTAIVPAYRHPETGKSVTAGAVILTPSSANPGENLKAAVSVIEVMLERWPGAVVAFDRHFGGGWVAMQLEEEHGITTVDVGMGAPFEYASEQLATLVDQQQLLHDDDQVVTDHVLAATAKRSRFAKRWRLFQPADGRPIDAASALAIALWIVYNPPAVTVKARPGFDIWG